ncbi:restriction endonuclease subunit M [Denitrobacterium detoxificans]|uniref:site-specific DNA-methyltransferase (adenine-specific) n=1 Tax=Denitrobacterium detoxificans TaxID=79604 RepID=A0A172RYP6_9ACTN|nr:class I SAM-dependent DNA methyltransferase [Denitrobacterium detoxificans]ANE22812.1 restriction endonuclease subunit M [Denitrobacterium detoxificans]SEO76225.1 type I restriction enzyme M protein [Denitrobacterium detoxificans]
MNHSEISSFIWGTADLLRSSFKQHEYGDIILPFTVMRRLDVVLEPTKQAVLEAAAKSVPAGPLRDKMLKKAAGVDFYNTSCFTMEGLLQDADGIRENITQYVTSFSSDIVDIFEKFKIFEVIKNLDEYDLLFLVVERFCNPKVDLSPESISNADMGDIYEELIRKFSEMSNETAGEHFSPRDGLRLASELLVAGEMDDLTRPNRIVKVCDPCAGTGGALTVFADRVAEINPQATVVTYAQEINGQSYAICKSDTILKGGNVVNVHLGDTLADDQMQGETFGYQISNPPYGVDWKKSKAAVTKERETLGFAGRFGAGLPRISDGQLLFVQHMVSKMRAPEDGGGRVAVFLNGSPLFTGSAGSGESEIRRYLLQHDLVDAIVAMPNDFFFNTGIATYIWVLDNTKEERRKGKVQLINANGIYNKMRKSLGSKRNEFSDEQIAQIIGLYNDFEDADSKLSKVFENDEFGYVTVDVRRPQRDEQGEIVRDKKGRPVADKELNDTENIPLTESVEDYMVREVLPYAPDAWIEPKKQKKGQMLELRDGGVVGYEIPFTRHFYEYTPLRPSSEILAEIRELEASIAEKLQKAGL